MAPCSSLELSDRLPDSSHFWLSSARGKLHVNSLGEAGVGSDCACSLDLITILLVAVFYFLYCLAMVSITAGWLNFGLLPFKWSAIYLCRI